MFRKVLISNRGEIAVRVIRALREMGIGSVAVFSDADRTALHVRMADEAVHIGPSPSAESYLRIDRILDAARERGAEAIHPGLRFPERERRIRRCLRTRPVLFSSALPPTAIRAMGSKTAARQLAHRGRRAGGARHRAAAGERAGGPRQCRREFGYPVLLKAALGGGGKGMRRVDCDAELESAFRDAASEAERAFAAAKFTSKS